MMNMLKALPVTSDDITLHTSPFSHIASVWPLLDHCYVGGANVTMEKFDPKVLLETIEEKTKGNLTEQEEKVLTNTLNQVRMAYVKVAE